MRAGNIELSLCAAAGAAAAGLAWSKYERGHFVTEELVFSSSKIKEPAILVFLSDLHDNTFGERWLQSQGVRIFPGQRSFFREFPAFLVRFFMQMEIMSRGCSGIGEFTGPCMMNFGSCWKNIR